MWHTVDGQIAPVASIGDLAVFQDPNGHFDSVYGRSAILEKSHCCRAGTVGSVGLRVLELVLVQGAYSSQAFRWMFSLATL